MTYKDFIEIKKLNQPVANFQKHHILPVCKGGDNSADNIIKLSYEDHWIAHKLLSEENPDDKKLVAGFRFMGSLESFIKKCEAISESHPERYTEEVRASMRKPKIYKSEEDRFNHRMKQSLNHKAPTIDFISDTLSEEEKLARFYKREEEKKLHDIRAYYKPIYFAYKQEIENKLARIAIDRNNCEEAIKTCDKKQKKFYKKQIQDFIIEKQKLNSLKNISFADWLVKNKYI